MSETNEEKAAVFSTIDKRTSEFLASLEDQTRDMQLSIACTFLGRLLLKDTIDPDKITEILINIATAVTTMSEAEKILPSEVELIIGVKGFANQTKH